MKTDRFALFPGCVMEAAGAEAMTAARAVAAALDMELLDIPGWTCCGATHAQDLEPELSLVMNARNLALAEDMGLPLLTICSTCSMVLNRTRDVCNAMDDAALEQKINRHLRVTGLQYRRSVTTTTLFRELYLRRDTLAGRRSKKLSGVSIAPFYGCHTLRSGEYAEYDNPHNPKALEIMIAALGASPVTLPGRLDCCGFHGIYPAREAAMRLAGNLAEQARSAHADALVTPCPLCQMQIDMYQQTGIPVLHLPQLVGMALNIPDGSLGLSRLLHPFRLP